MEGVSQINASRRSILVCVTALLSGCCFPYVHTAQEYSSPAPFPPNSAPQRTPESGPYFVGDAYVKSRIFEEDEDERGAPKFRFIVGVAYGTHDIDQVIVHKLHVKADDAELTGGFFEDGGKTKRASFPLTEPFVVAPSSSRDAGSHYLYSETFDAGDIDFEVLSLIVDIEIVTTAGSDRKTVVHEFDRVVMVQLLSCAEV